MDLLALRHILAFRVNQRPVLTGRGWRNPGADPGAPDIFACLPGGRAFLIELKTGLARLSPVQVAALRGWRAQGALTAEIRNVAELYAVLRDHCA
jgi:hypothetical protein